jgi:hypothetical protein
MAEKMTGPMNTLNISSVKGTSMALNTQKGYGGMKPSAQGNANPGDTNPGKDTCGTVSVP